MLVPKIRDFINNLFKQKKMIIYMNKKFHQVFKFNKKKININPYG